MLRNWLVLALEHPLVQLLHVTGLEGELETCHLIGDASHRPDITFEVIGFVLPYLWTCIIRRPCLCVVEPVGSGKPGDVEVAYLDDVVLRQENVRRLPNECSSMVQDILL